jgi:pantetheine-phosphate adenylyltransferase
VTARFDNVEVRTFSGLAVHFLRQCGARVMIRGIRPLSDLAAELTMTMANRRLDPDIETIFLIADEQYAHVSSSLIKQITPMATDAELAHFVPGAIIADLRAKISGSQP